MTLHDDVILSRKPAKKPRIDPFIMKICRQFRRLTNFARQLVKMKCYFVYIMANKSGTLYTGVTNDLERRVFEHKNKRIPGFTKKYNMNRLVYFEETSDIQQALVREKQKKGLEKGQEEGSNKICESPMEGLERGMVKISCGEFSHSL